MAAAGNALRLCLRSCRQPTAPLVSMKPSARQTLTIPRRTFTTTTTRVARDGSGESDAQQTLWPHIEDAFKDLSPEELKQLEKLIEEDPVTGEVSSFSDALARDERDPDMKASANRKELQIVLGKVNATYKHARGDFFEDDQNTHTPKNHAEDEFNENDITDMAHSKLDEIREQRHYARIAAWEMPLLSKLAKPFEPPTAQQPLRFRYTTYMGEYHPAEKKVVVEFSPKDMGLTPVQTEKLKKLVGTRYNPTKDVIKMSCESFGQPAQNKRYLSDLVDKLLATAKDPKDTFEDVPLDTRHHKVETKPKFPKEWYLTEERKRQLAAERAAAARADAGRKAEGRLIDGVKSIDAFLNPPVKAKEASGAPEALADLVAAKYGKASGKTPGKAPRVARR